MIKVDELWSALPIAALALSREGCILHSNLAAQSMLGSSQKKLDGLSIWRVLSLPDEFEIRVKRGLDQAKALRVDSCNVFAIQPDGYVPYEGGLQKAIGLCGLQLVDIEGQDDAMLLTLVPKEMLSQVEHVQHQLGQPHFVIGLADMLAHEIKNPLSGIRGAAQLIAMDGLKEHVDMTDLIVSECERIVTLLEKVEQFGNLPPPDITPVNIHDVLERARCSAALGVARHMTFKQEFDPSLPAALCDEGQLLQVILNILKNAAEAQSEGEKEGRGVVILRTFFESSMRIKQPNGEFLQLPLHIEIVDNGPGIPGALLARIFEPFVSGKSKKSGLGLALVASLIEQMGGCVKLTSIPGKTVVRLSLPMVQPRSR